MLDGLICKIEKVVMPIIKFNVSNFPSQSKISHLYRNRGQVAVSVENKRKGGSFVVGDCGTQIQNCRHIYADTQKVAVQNWIE